MKKYLTFSSENGTTFAVPVEQIAENRAKHYAEEFGGDIGRSLSEDTIPLFEEDDYEIWDWFRGNMDPCDAECTMIVSPVPATADQAFIECEGYGLQDTLVVAVMSGAKFTPGPWTAFNLVHAETGNRMTPEDVGEYVANCVRVRPDCDDFLLISAEKPDGPGDVCHIGNGPDGPFNAHLIAAAPDLYAALASIENDAGRIPKAIWDMRNAALAKARGES